MSEAALSLICATTPRKLFNRQSDGRFFLDCVHEAAFPDCDASSTTLEEKLTCFFDTALNNGQSFWIQDYIEDVCANQRLSSSDPRIAYLIDGRFVVDWIRKRLHFLSESISHALADPVSDGGCFFELSSAINLSSKLKMLTTSLELLASSVIPFQALKPSSSGLSILDPDIRNANNLFKLSQVIVWCAQHDLFSQNECLFSNLLPRTASNKNLESWIQRIECRRANAAAAFEASSLSDPSLLEITPPHSGRKTFSSTYRFSASFPHPPLTRPRPEGLFLDRLLARVGLPSIYPSRDLYEVLYSLFFFRSSLSSSSSSASHPPPVPFPAFLPRLALFLYFLLDSGLLPGPFEEAGRKRQEEEEPDGNEKKKRKQHQHSDVFGLSSSASSLSSSDGEVERRGEGNGTDGRENATAMDGRAPWNVDEDLKPPFHSTVDLEDSFYSIFHIPSDVMRMWKTQYLLDVAFEHFDVSSQPGSLNAEGQRLVQAALSIILPAAAASDELAAATPFGQREAEIEDEAGAESADESDEEEEGEARLAFGLTVGRCNAELPGRDQEGNHSMTAPECHWSNSDPFCLYGYFPYLKALLVLACPQKALVVLLSASGDRWLAGEFVGRSLVGWNASKREGKKKDSLTLDQAALVVEIYLRSHRLSDTLHVIRRHCSSLVLRPEIAKLHQSVLIRRVLHYVFEDGCGEEVRGLQESILGQDRSSHSEDNSSPDNSHSDSNDGSSLVLSAGKGSGRRDGREKEGEEGYDLDEGKKRAGGKRKRKISASHRKSMKDLLRLPFSKEEEQVFVDWALSQLPTNGNDASNLRLLACRSQKSRLQPLQDLSILLPRYFLDRGRPVDALAAWSRFSIHADVHDHATRVLMRSLDRTYASLPLSRQWA